MNSPFAKPLRDLLDQSTVPFRVEPRRHSVPVPPTAPLQDLYLDHGFALRDLLKNPSWLDQDILRMAQETPDALAPGCHLGAAFDLKYATFPASDDARSVAPAWDKDLSRALSHVSQSTHHGSLLHIGSDGDREPAALYTAPSCVTLVDVAEGLLRHAAQASPTARTLHTSAELLHGIPDNSIDLAVALRVFSSAGLHVPKALRRIRRALRVHGSVLLSLANGYRANDDTILPGQLTDSPIQLSLSRPFEEALAVLRVLDELGFRELFLTYGSTELFLGGTYVPESKHGSPGDRVLHVDAIDSVPLCFFSAAMPQSWLGNYSPHPIALSGRSWPTVEHFFQASKFGSETLQAEIRNATTPAEAKALAWSRPSAVRPDWTSIRGNIMREGIHAKFSQHPHLVSPLLLTAGRDLIERSPSDTYWGQSLSGFGANAMGQVLMSVRAEFRARGVP